MSWLYCLGWLSSGLYTGAVVFYVSLAILGCLEFGFGFFGVIIDLNVYILI